MVKRPFFKTGEHCDNRKVGGAEKNRGEAKSLASWCAGTAVSEMTGSK